MSGAHLLGLTALALMAFAANSVLNRMAVGPGLIDPLAFALVRLMAGAGTLALLVGLRALRGGAIWAGWSGRGGGVVGLVAYLVGFSVAYQSLGAGAGALVLFGTVQVTMFIGAILAREAIPARRWFGAGLAFAGLVALVAPGGAEVAVHGAVAMAIAGMGWGVYSLAGRRSGDAVAATAWNFGLAVPVLLGIMAILPVSPDAVPAQAQGLWLAVVSGAITSGLGYALWYQVVPHLGAVRAAVAQLTVPMLAACAGVVWLGEAVDLRFALASAMILGGVAVASLQSGFTRR